MKKVTFRRRDVIIVAVVLSLVLYMAGVFSGLFANKIMEDKVSTELEDIKKNLYISALDIKNIQLQQLLLDNMEDRCRFYDTYLNQQYEILKYFWDKLPKRLEEYDKTKSQSAEYIALKREYIRLSLRYWIVAKKYYNECEAKDFIPLLDFYSKDCKDCVSQGIEFEKFSTDMSIVGKTVLVFPIDIDFEDDSIYLLRKYYNISKMPAVVIGDEVYQGEVITRDELHRRFE